MLDVSKTPVSDFDAAVRLLSGGTNVAIYNDLGLPSIYVRRDNGLISDVIEGGSAITHPAFIVNGVEVPSFYMGKYLATVYKGRALSLPLQHPAHASVDPSDRGSAKSDFVTIDNAKIWCEANGPGFHLPTIAEYAWIALLSRRNCTMPRGNTYRGVDYSFTHESGVVSTLADLVAATTLTGSGPATWNDNWKPDGICDMNGNVCEWQGGYRTVDGEIQIFCDNDAASQVAQTADSTLWRAILQDGTLVAPGTVNTLKWDFFSVPTTSTPDVPFRLNTTLEFQQTSAASNGMMDFASLTAADGVNVPEILKALALMPDGTGGSYGDDYVYMKNIGERLVCRGGRFSGRTHDAGIFLLSGRNQRTYADQGIGFRPAFIPGI
jgi:hypothetical protein